MATVNTRGAYELLRRALIQQSLQQQEGNSSLSLKSRPGPDADGYGSSKGSSLGNGPRAEQSGKDAMPYQQPQDPNFRQLSRTPIVNRPLSNAYGGEFSTPRLPIAAPLRWSGNGMRIPLQPIPPGPPPPFSMPAIPNWWKAFGTILRIDRFPDLPRDSEGDEHRRCLRAANGSTTDWEELCKYRDFGWNKTSGGETQNRACWSKTHESKATKKLWCDLQFGDD